MAEVVSACSDSQTKPIMSSGQQARWGQNSANSGLDSAVAPSLAPQWQASEDGSEGPSCSQSSHVPLYLPGGVPLASLSSLGASASAGVLLAVGCWGPQLLIYSSMQFLSICLEFCLLLMTCF